MKKIKELDKAPEFTLKDINDKEIDLKTYKGKFVLLSFYRYASCPLCNLRVHESIKMNKSKDDLNFIAVFQSPKEKISHYVGKQKLTFPLIANPEKTLYSLYGVEPSWLGFFKAWIFQWPRIIDSVIKKGFLPGSMENGAHQLPADFLIGPKGEILIAYYGTDISEHVSFEAVLKVIKRYNF